MSEGKPELLLDRLEEIGAVLARSGKALALIGLGSAGNETGRLDEFSDLDFFAIVENGHKYDFIDDLSWLSSICPVAFSYRNTRDGHKVMFSDDVFCEFAVFEFPELEQIPFAPGRIVWQRADVPDVLLQPAQHWQRQEERSIEWLMGEVLSNLYAGLSRQGRGEKLAAMRAIQVHAVERVLELAVRIETEAAAVRDIFAFERRYEQRYPDTARTLPRFMQGYQRNNESALAILDYLELHFEPNLAMVAAIRKLSTRLSRQGGSQCQG
ncbi:MAG: hypothetical protein PHP05_02460 [Sideroxydans sp.]|nr:hypothetical protein [Sideroxydans sp.]MDD5470765.1 hypothetical protein [Sideroxydans sp.]